MKIRVRDYGEKFEIENVETKTKFKLFYDNDKSYIKNILSCLPNMGIVEYISYEKYDEFELKELK